MFGLIKFIVLILALGTAKGLLAADLQPYEAVYENKQKGFNVHVNRRLQIRQNEDEKSVLLFHEDGPLYPVTHVHKRRGTSHEHDKDLVFNWTDNTVIDLLEPGREPLPVDKPSYDKLSYLTQMRLDLKRDPQLQYIEYWVTNGIRNRVYTFERLSEEVLETLLGKLNTIKFRRGGDDDNREVFIWVASDWDYLLVRLDQTKERGGKTERLVLESATVAGKTVNGLSE